MCCAALCLQIYPRSVLGIAGQTALTSVKQLFLLRLTKLKYSSHRSTHVFPLKWKKKEKVQRINSDAVYTTVLCCSCTKPHKMTTTHRNVTGMFPLAFETTLNYSILNFLLEHLFLCPCSLEDTSRKGHLY